MAKGKAKTLAMNHKSSRVLQSILKWGNDSQKADLIAEAVPSLVRLVRRLLLRPLPLCRPETPSQSARVALRAPLCAFLDQVELAKDTYGTHLARKIVDIAGKPELPNLLKAVKVNR